MKPRPPAPGEFHLSCDPKDAPGGRVASLLKDSGDGTPGAMAGPGRFDAIDVYREGEHPARAELAGPSRVRILGDPSGSAVAMLRVQYSWGFRGVTTDLVSAEEHEERMRRIAEETSQKRMASPWPSAPLAYGGGTRIDLAPDNAVLATAAHRLLGHLETPWPCGLALVLGEYVVSGGTALTDEGRALARRLHGVVTGANGPSLRDMLTLGEEVREAAVLDTRFAEYLDALGDSEGAQEWRQSFRHPDGEPPDEAWRGWVDLRSAPAGCAALVALARAVWLAPLRRPVQLGPSDFVQLRRTDGLYIDKTWIVRDVLEGAAQVQLITRPRRFGKTLNLSTIRHYLASGAEDLAGLFRGLDITTWDAHDRHFQRYPVVFLTFKDVKHPTWQECLEDVGRLLAEAVSAHRTTLEPHVVLEPERARLDRLLQEKATTVDLKASLRLLTQWLHDATGRPCVLLIDEYDTPIHEASERGYYDDAIEFFGPLLSGGLKDNPALFRGVLTGILRVAREGIFSGLNNLAVYSPLESEFAARFGFTASEVRAVAEAHGFRRGLPEVEAWYDGYTIGQQRVYNPWSVLKVAADENHECRPYWSPTASDRQIERFLVHGPPRPELARDMLRLLNGEVVNRAVETDLTLREVEDGSDGAVLGLFVFSGYLTASRSALPGTWALRVPNREVRSTFEGIYRRHTEHSLGGAVQVRALIEALLAGEETVVQSSLERITRGVPSGHDLPHGNEMAFHNFVLGMLVWMGDTHVVRSNREAGLGRYDISLEPRVPSQVPGVLIEFKAAKSPKDLDAELDAAAQQMAERDYAADLRERGVARINGFAVASSGRVVQVRSIPLS